MFEFEPLYKKKKKKREKGGERKINYLFIYLFVLYGGTSGLHAHTWHALVRSGLLLLTRSRWNAVRGYGIQCVCQC